MEHAITEVVSAIITEGLQEQKSLAWPCFKDRKRPHGCRLMLSEKSAHQPWRNSSKVIPGWLLRSRRSQATSRSCRWLSEAPTPPRFTPEAEVHGL